MNAQPVWIILAACLHLGSQTHAAEPWSDPRLKIRSGLQLWLDASRTTGTQPVPADNRLSQWMDASGHGRHMKQARPHAQPLRRPLGNIALVHFDGVDDVLRSVKHDFRLKSFSVFLVTVPRRNPGMFTGLLAFNAPGQRDYQSGLNLDFGPSPTPHCSVINAEGTGFGGYTNLRTASSPFGELLFLELASDGEAASVSLSINGRKEGQRPRTAGSISMEEITIGARFYNNGPGGQVVAGHCCCDIAEVLVFDRSLKSEDLSEVRKYLHGKYSFLKDALPNDLDDQSQPLTPVKNPPPVQVLVPGFAVRELPIDLTNINNIKYRRDGTLVALGYNGNIWLLKDTNADGLEDHAALFWENRKSLASPIGMDLTPDHYPHGKGVFVASEGKCVLIVDSDGDDKGDRELVVAGGWKDRSVNIDVIGVAVHPKDGSVYFGRGTPNYANGYLLDKDGKAHYSLNDERGTIQRVTPDFRSREVIATGIRFPVGMRFNRLGDLFASDQEGATWMPNGNPFDELLHIQKGRFYGFPPRHPTHLPGVIDEPSVVDYGPQHQSTCGICFNEPVRLNGPVFGPAWWAGDCFVTGYSRGKLYRSKLVKTPSGYVGQTQLFACLSMLTVDACITPDGSMLVACHSGGPDWGSGPTGKGKLFKITYQHRDLPLPVFAWHSSPSEIRIEFDRPVEPALLRDTVKQPKITAGQFVRAGDRFETLWPGYAVVQAQKVAPRFDIPVRSAQLTSDRRSLILATDHHTAAMHYAITLQGMGRAEIPASGELSQHSQLDLDCDMSGCSAEWKAHDGSLWSGWLPSPDLVVARSMTAGSATHNTLWQAMTRPGVLTLRCKLNLKNMLRPLIQPGSQLDYELPPEKTVIHHESSKDVEVTVKTLEQTGQPVEELTLKYPKGTNSPVFTRSFTTAENSLPRPLQLHRFMLPWADPAAKTVLPISIKPPVELEGGSWARGRSVFFSELAACSKCHALDGRGESIGPDLGNLIHRDYRSVLRDIEQPNFAINPDHLTQTLVLHDGRTLTGVVQTVGKKLRIGDNRGNITEVLASDVETRLPTAVSTMPDDVIKKLGPEKIKDLLTFLMTSPVSMPRDYPGKRPRPRTVAEVNTVLAGSPAIPLKTRPLRIVLVAGPKDHGPGEHDYPAFQKAWAELLASAPAIDVVKAWEWPQAEEFHKADAMVFYQRGDWNSKRAADIDAFLNRGGGLVYIHWAVDGRNEGPAFAQRIGLAGRNSVAFRHGDIALTMHEQNRHPVMRNMNKLDLIDETYWKMTGRLNPDRVLASSLEEKEPRPQIWSLEQGRGRIFVSIPGHYSHTFDDPLFRIVLLRGIAWSAHEPVDRFNDLVWPGANLAK